MRILGRARNVRQILALTCVILLISHQPIHAEVNYHLVGWFNFFIPGGGKLLEGQPLEAGEQATLEIGTFAWGYSLSARQPMTLDGVPEDLPTPQTGIFQKHSTTRICYKYAANGKCSEYRNVKGSYNATNGKTQDITKSLYADWLQEVGIKAHMVNVYDAYREAAKAQGVDFNIAQIDPTPTGQLFLAPFNLDNIFDNWVWIPLVLTAGALVYSYSTYNASDYPAVSQFNATSNALYKVTYLGVYPVGSAAPEEMFYRGFIQGEMHSLTGSHWLSVPISTSLYALSHSSDAQLGAAVSGLFLGILTAHERGRLRLGITYHFWSDIMTGIYSIALLKLQQKNANAAPAALRMNFTF